MDGNFHMNKWYDGESYLVQRSCRVMAKDSLLQSYLSHAMRAPIYFYQSTIQGATVGHLGAKHLNEIDIIIPPKKYLPLLEKLNNIDELVLNLELSNREMQKQKNELLPRLMSGKLSVENLDIAFSPSMQTKDNNVQ